MTGRVLGVILAGGQARRMGGGDKGRLDLGGRSLLAEVIARLRPQCADLVLNANGDPQRFADLGLEVIADDIAGFAGPLAGVLAGMDHAAGRGFSHLLTAAADTPFLPHDLCGGLASALSPDCPIALAATRQGERQVRHPTFGLWPVLLRHDLRDAIGQGIAKITQWTDRHGTAWAEFATGAIDPFFNVNTPEDLQTARDFWQKSLRGA